MKNNTLFYSILPLSITLGCNENKRDIEKPNIIVIYIDDLGYGDIRCNGAASISTPSIDSLAANGLILTDAHSTAATSTPSRFSLLTGSYAFRSDATILQGDAPALIKQGTATIASMLQQAKYRTAIIGKWHLGLGDGNLNWNDSIKPGPLDIGFDYSFIIPATGDRVPCVFVENYNIVGLDSNDPIQVSYSEPIGDWPTGLSNPNLLKQKADEQHSNTIINGISRIGYMTGGTSALWKDEEFANVLTQKAYQFIKENKEKPFFLFFSMHDIHVPRVVNPQFCGKSSMGARGDAILQMDWMTGQIVNSLKELGLEENTLIIFTSDNGPVVNDGYEDQSAELLGKHKPAGELRGGKYSAFEGGTRMPTIVYWPNKVKHGKSNALLSQVDLYASLAALVNVPIGENSAPDSENHIDAWLGYTDKGRDVLLEQSVAARALRMGNWKYIEKQKQLPFDDVKKIELGIDTIHQLYDLSIDLHEQNNLGKQYPKIASTMDSILLTIYNSKQTRKK